MNNHILSLIGLATRAGKTVSGEYSTEKSIKSGKATLAVIAEDASENTKKKFRNMCSYYHVPCYFLSDKESLGSCMGKEFRASLALEDENFSKAIRKEMERAHPAQVIESPNQEGTREIPERIRGRKEIGADTGT